MLPTTIGTTLYIENGYFNAVTTAQIVRVTKTAVVCDDGRRYAIATGRAAHGWEAAPMTDAKREILARRAAARAARR
jgi:hypothetical protein